MKRSLILFGLLLLPLSASASFSDVSATHQNRRPIEYLQQAGVLHGYQDGLFRPAFTINRAEFLKVLVAARGIDPPADLYSNCFPDVKDEWYARYVCYALSQEWVQGYPDGTFGPERPVSFVEAVKMLVNVRGYLLAESNDIERRGLDSSVWFTPYLTTALLRDVVSYEQVWGQSAIPLQSALTRGRVAEFIYRSLLSEGVIIVPLSIASCGESPSSIKVRTFVDVILPGRQRLFRQNLEGTSCVIGEDLNPFGRVTEAYNSLFLQPYPDGQPKDEWTVTLALTEGRGALRAATLDGDFRAEFFSIDVQAGEMRQLPPMRTLSGGMIESTDHRFIAYIGMDGTTVEVIDTVRGAHRELDRVTAPYTFAARQAADGTSEGATLAFVSTTRLSYALYDSSVQTGGNNTIVEIRTADLATSSSPPPFPFAP